MRQVPHAEFALLLLQHLILAGLVLRVIVTGLFRTYPYFFGYLLVASLQALILAFLSPGSPSYEYPWMITQALLTCSGVFVLLELYALVLRDLRGIASTSRRYLKICLGLAISASLLLLLVENAPIGPITAFMVIDRALVTSMLIFLLLLTAFMVYYPIPINRNLVVYSIGYAVYFLTKASSLLMLNTHYAWIRPFAFLVITACTVSMLFWLVGLRSEGAEREMTIGHRWNRENQDELLAQLKAINASLLRGRRGRM
jgi:hypothetical protein